MEPLLNKGVVVLKVGDYSQRVEPFLRSLPEVKDANKAYTDLFFDCCTDEHPEQIVERSKRWTMKKKD